MVIGGGILVMEKLCVGFVQVRGSGWPRRVCVSVPDGAGDDDDGLLAMLSRWEVRLWS